MKYKIIVATPDQEPQIQEEILWSKRTGAEFAGLPYTETGYTVDGLSIMFFVTQDTNKAMIDRAAKTAFQSRRSVINIDFLLIPKEWLNVSETVV